MTDDPRTITDRLATIEQQLARILAKIDPDPSPPQFGAMLGTPHFAPFAGCGRPTELPVTVGKTVG